MPEFDRLAATLAELDRHDDPDIAQAAQIAFRTHDDHGTLADMRAALVEEYRSGRAWRRDRWLTARRVGEAVAGHGELADRFAAVHRIEEMPTIPDDGTRDRDHDIEYVHVAADDTVGQIMAAALALRFAHAAHTLLGVLEEWADEQETDHDTGPDDQD